MAAISAAVLLLLSAIAFVRGRRFRSGASRSLLPFHRNTALPNVVRNLPLLSEFLAVQLLGFAALLAAPLVRRQLNTAEYQALALLIIAGLTLSFGASVFLLHSPPKWIIPDWLVRQNREDNFVPPAASAGDHLFLVIGVLGILIGLFLLWAALVVETPLG